MSAAVRHLARCGQRTPSPSKVSDRSARDFHLVAVARHTKDYWLHIAVPVNARLSTVDQFLRGIWLECCGHLSAFSIDGVRYATSPSPDAEEASMSATLGTILDAGARFFYEYDYGSTTELVLTAVGFRERTDRKPGVRLLARNNPPERLCSECGSRKLATDICVECAWTEKGFLCKECAESHSCDPGMLLPVVNSPRAGVCGYTG